MKRALTALLLILFLGTVSAFQAGSSCYAKRARVPLLTAPDRTATPVGSVNWGAALAVTAVQDRWLQVRSGGMEGWVFAGNVALDKPPAENKSDFLPTAGETGAAVAARPLSSAARAFAGRRGAADALGDLQWMESFTNGITADELQTYQQEAQKGDFTP